MTPELRQRAVKLGLGSAIVIGFTVALVVVRTSVRERDLTPLRLAFRERRFDDARRFLDAWHTAEPRSPLPAFWEGRLALAEGDPNTLNKAISESERLGLDRDRLDLLKALSTARNGRFDEVEPRLRETVNQSDPNDLDPLVLEALAVGYLQHYDLIRARLAIDRWIEFSPNDAAPYLQRAEIDSRTSNLSAVIVDYREALKRDPSLDKAKLALANALRETHQSPEAAEVIAGYLKGHGNDPLGHLAAGKIAAENGFNDKALNHFQRATALEPKNPIAHKDLGEILLRSGKGAEALDELQKAKELDPFDLEVRHNLGLALVKVGRAAEAKQEQATASRFRNELQTMLSAQSRLLKNPADLESRLVICRWMFEHGKSDQGKLWAESILKDHQGRPEASLLLSDYYRKAGQNGLANYHRMQAEQPSRTMTSSDSLSKAR